MTAPLPDAELRALLRQATEAMAQLADPRVEMRAATIIDLVEELLRRRAADQQAHSLTSSEGTKET